jgi:N-acetylmuramoyl-L-alanine amidase
VTGRASAILGLLLAAAVTAPAGAIESARPAKPQALPPAAFPVASDVRLGGDEGQTRFVVDLSRKVELRAFTLADPYRVVVDIPQVMFKFPPKTGEKGRGLVRAFRYGLIMQGGSRMVLDVTKPVRIEKSFVLDATDSQPARLVIDLAATDRESFMRNLAVENKAARALEVSPRREASPAIAGDPRPIVVIDPGHGGIDTGTTAANGIAEKTIVLEFGLLLRDHLEKTGRYRVVMTRTDDSFVPLGGRVRLARERKAELFISIHADSLPKSEGDVQGATVYTLSEQASDSEAARLAEAENRADVIAGIDLTAEANDVADILIDLAQRETKTFSVHFARSLVAELKNSVRLHKKPIKSAGFKVLRAPDVPSVLLELGYVSNREDLALLNSAAWRNKTAASVVQAVDAYFSTRLAGASPLAGAR